MFMDKYVYETKAHWHFVNGCKTSFRVVTEETRLKSF